MYMKRVLMILLIWTLMIGCQKRKNCESAKIGYEKKSKEMADYVLNNYNGDTPSEATVKLQNYNGALDRYEIVMKNSCKD